MRISNLPRWGACCLVGNVCAVSVTPLELPGLESESVVEVVGDRDGSTVLHTRTDSIFPEPGGEEYEHIIRRLRDSGEWQEVARLSASRHNSNNASGHVRRGRLHQSPDGIWFIGYSTYSYLFFGFPGHISNSTGIAAILGDSSAILSSSSTTIYSSGPVTTERTQTVVWNGALDTIYVPTSTRELVWVSGDVEYRQSIGNRVMPAFAIDDSGDRLIGLASLGDRIYELWPLASGEISIRQLVDFDDGVAKRVVAGWRNAEKEYVVCYVEENRLMVRDVDSSIRELAVAPPSAADATPFGTLTSGEWLHLFPSGLASGTGGAPAYGGILSVSQEGVLVHYDFFDQRPLGNTARKSVDLLSPDEPIVGWSFAMDMGDGSVVSTIYLDRFDDGNWRRKDVTPEKLRHGETSLTHLTSNSDGDAILHTYLDGEYLRIVIPKAPDTADHWAIP